MFFGSIVKKNKTKLDSHGRFYTTPFTAIGAIIQANHNPDNYQLLTYEVKLENTSEDIKPFVEAIKKHISK